MSDGIRQFVRCPYCQVRIRADRLEKHYFRIHGKRLSNTQVASVLSQKGGQNKPARRRFGYHFEARRAEEKFQKYVEQLKTVPRKCETGACLEKVMPPEAFCNACKQARSNKTTGLNEKGGPRWGGCLTCGGPTVSGENYCYSCLGD